MSGTTIDTTVTEPILATVKAWDANDAEAFAEVYAPDATVVLTGGVFLRGREEIRQFMTAGFTGRLRGTRSVDEQESVRRVGDCAIVVSRSGYLLPGEESVAPEQVRRATWTLSRHDEGWRIESYHNCPI
jgi:uncharacterized protein (TIGR02246 family)